MKDDSGEAPVECQLCHKTREFGHLDPDNLRWYCEECWRSFSGDTRRCFLCRELRDSGSVDRTDKRWYCNSCWDRYEPKDKRSNKKRGKSPRSGKTQEKRRAKTERSSSKSSGDSSGDASARTDHCSRARTRKGRRRSRSRRRRSRKLPSVARFANDHWRASPQREVSLRPSDAFRTGYPPGPHWDPNQRPAMVAPCAPGPCHPGCAGPVRYAVRHAFPAPSPYNGRPPPSVYSGRPPAHWHPQRPQMLRPGPWPCPAPPRTGPHALPGPGPRPSMHGHIAAPPLRLGVPMLCGRGFL